MSKKDKQFKVQIGNFVLTVEDSGEGHDLVVRNVGGGWQMRFADSFPTFAVFIQLAQMAEKDKNAYTVLENTLSGIFIVSTAGVHDPYFSNAIADAIEGLNNRIAAALGKHTDMEAEEKDAADWMERDRVLQEMMEKDEGRAD